MDKAAPSATRHFKVAAVRGDHAGNAYITLHHHSGAMVAIHHLPFQQNPGERPQDEQYRMLHDAEHLVREAVEFLQGQSREDCLAPTSEMKVGPAPHEGEPPNPFGLMFGR